MGWSSVLPAAGIEGISGTAISAAQEALKTGVIGRRTVTTYHYAKKDIVEEESFTFRLWELVLAGAVALTGYGIYNYEKDRKARGDELNFFDVIFKTTGTGALFELLG